MQFTPTHEQHQIGRAMSSGDPLLINAFAGSGKSATLRYLHNLYDKTGELWCFNKRNAIEAQVKFNKTKTVCCTSHSKAFRAMSMFGYGAKLREKWPIWMIGKELGVRSAFGITTEHITYAALQSLRRWMHSADPEITIHHCWDRLRAAAWFVSQLDAEFARQFPDATPAARQQWLTVDRQKFAQAALTSYRETLLAWAKQIWSAMWNQKNPMPMDHDAYLKAYQLTAPVLSGIDYLMVDEYQDTNPCVADIVNRQTCQVIVVGDRYQGIYGFRGATNEMDHFFGHNYYLTESFRFGQEGATVANSILSAHYENIPQLRGNKNIHTTLGPVDQSQPYTIITRSNAGLFTCAVRTAAQGKSLHVVGSLRDSISRVRSIYGIYVDDRSLVKHPDIKPYEDWATVVNEAEFDAEIKRYVDSVYEYEGKLPDVCDSLEKAGEVKANQAHVILTTAHKSKGLEFTQVVMAEDFESLRVKRNEATGKSFISGSDEEFNVLYVAATRAINRLEINSITQAAMELSA